MITPYDWQEGIGNRAQYIEGKLKHGSPVLAVSLEAGILIYTRRRQTRKIFEVYDRLGFSAVGQQSDVEALRTAAVEFAHQEGYNRSEQDVTVQRVATALSAPVKKAFGDFSSSPLVARSLFVEVNDTVEEDLYYVLNYDGDYALTRRNAVVAGTEAAADTATEALSAFDPNLSIEDATTKLGEIWQRSFSLHEEEKLPDEDLKPEVVLIERSKAREDRFRILSEAD
jgi:proteasome alpha subunit